jgi:hypothetical protein
MQVIQANIDHYSKKPRIGKVYLKNQLLEVSLPSSTSILPKLAKQQEMYGLKKPNPKYIEDQTICKK